MARTWEEKLAEAIPILTLGAGLLALFLGVDDWWVIFIVGFVVLTPLADILVDDTSEESSSGTGERTAGANEGESDTEDALETLRDRYARGELTEAEFERKVERLLETETVDDARERVGGAGSRSTNERESDRATE